MAKRNNKKRELKRKQKENKNQIKPVTLEVQDSTISGGTQWVK